MKIAIIRKKYTFHGGAEVFSKSFIEHLANEGHEIHVFAIKWQSESINKNIHFHKVPAIMFNSFLRDLSFAVSTFFMLKKDRDRFDIIQTHDRTLFQDVYRALDGCHIEWMKQRLKRIGIARKISIVINPYHWLILAIEHMIFKHHRFKKVLALSEMVKRNIIDNYNVPASDIEVIYNGVDIKKYHPDNRTHYRSEIRNKHGLTDNEFLILFVGSGFERKGVKYLIEAVEAVSEPVSVLIVGRGPESRFRDMIKKQKIIFCGPQKDVYKYYAAADIFVFPTLYEPFGTVHLGSWRDQGLPFYSWGVLYKKTFEVQEKSGNYNVTLGEWKGTAAEIIVNGKHGFVVDCPENTREIADMIKFIMNKDEKQKMSIEARKLAEDFTHEKHISKIITLYGQILN